MNALILVDIQNDFLPGGALAVPRGDEVVPVANRLMRSELFGLVVATQDWHPKGHGSFAISHAGRCVGEIISLNGVEQVLWPEHCVQGTRGAELSPELERGRVHHLVRKGTDPGLDSYSGFFDNGGRHATGLNEILHQAGATRLWVVGLATDYCVQATVLDARKLGFEVQVVLEGVRGVELRPGDTDRAVERMRAAGAEMVNLM